MIRFAVLILLAFSLWSHGATAADKFNSESGKYSVAFPAKPTASEKEIETPVGKLTMYVAALEVKKDLGFIVIHVDYPEAVKQQKAKDVLKRTRDGSRGPNDILIDEKELTLDGRIPGLEYILKKEDGIYYRVRVYLDGARLYQVIVSTARATDLKDPRADDFLDSFELSK